MNLLNATGMQAGYTLGMQPDGRELLVVAVKGTFRIPDDGGPVRLADTPLPLVEADTFTGEPGFSAPLYEADYSPRKARCDVLLLGNAHAPGGRPVSLVQVGLKVGELGKRFNVLGERCWSAGVSGIKPGAAAPFVVQPISYDHAFGGRDEFHADPRKHSAFMANPVGKGFHRELDSSLVDGSPMPNTEEPQRPVETPDGEYHPMSLGPLGRGWEPRLRYAGTYDQDWLDNVFPFLPADFDEYYYQAAPPDQQMPYPVGGEEVVLVNLSPTGRVQFQLPRVDVPVVFFRKRGENHETRGVIDTIVLEPEQSRFTMTWRATLPLRKNMFEIAEVLVGRMSRAWWRARELGKDYYPSLDSLARSQESADED